MRDVDLGVADLNRLRDDWHQWTDAVREAQRGAPEPLVALLIAQVPQGQWRDSVEAILVDALFARKRRAPIDPRVVAIIRRAFAAFSDKAFRKDAGIAPDATVDEFLAYLAGAPTLDALGRRVVLSGAVVRDIIYRKKTYGAPPERRRKKGSKKTKSK